MLKKRENSTFLRDRLLWKTACPIVTNLRGKNNLAYSVKIGYTGDTEKR